MRSLYLLSLFALSAQMAVASEHQTYMSLGIGAVFPMQDSTTSGDSSSVLYKPTVPGTSLFSLPNVTWKNEYDPGFELNIAVGRRLDNDLRLEGEFLYQYFNRDVSGHYDWQEIDAITTLPFDAAAGQQIPEASEPTSLYMLFANTYYDFKNKTALTPFIGGGIGIAWAASEAVETDGMLVIHTDVPPVDADAMTHEKSPSLYGTAFAWQVKVGLDYAINTQLSVDILYRLVGTTEFQASDSYIITNPDSPPDSSVFNIGQDNVEGFINSSLNLGIRYRF